MDEDTVREQEGGKRRDIRMKREERKGKHERRGGRGNRDLEQKS